MENIFKKQLSSDMQLNPEDIKKSRETELILENLTELDFVLQHRLDDYKNEFLGLGDKHLQSIIDGIRTKEIVFRTFSQYESDYAREHTATQFIPVDMSRVNKFFVAKIGELDAIVATINNSADTLTPPVLKELFSQAKVIIESLPPKN